MAALRLAAALLAAAPARGGAATDLQAQGPRRALLWAEQHKAGSTSQSETARCRDVYDIGTYGMAPWGNNVANWPDSTADWIWNIPGAASNAPVSRTIYYYGLYQAPAATAGATVTATIDNMGSFSLNGVTVGSVFAWNEPSSASVNLVAGPNVFGIAGTNTGGAAGAILSVKNAQGQVLFNTGDWKQWRWSFSPTVPTNCFLGTAPPVPSADSSTLSSSTDVNEALASEAAPSAVTPNVVSPNVVMPPTAAVATDSAAAPAAASGPVTSVTNNADAEQEQDVVMVRLGKNETNPANNTRVNVNVEIAQQQQMAVAGKPAWPMAPPHPMGQWASPPPPARPPWPGGHWAPHNKDTAAQQQQVVVELVTVAAPSSDTDAIAPASPPTVSAEMPVGAFMPDGTDGTGAAMPGPSPTDEATMTPQQKKKFGQLIADQEKQQQQQAKQAAQASSDAAQHKAQHNEHLP